MQHARAALWMIGAIFSFTSMAIAGREIAENLDTFEIMLYRSIIGFVIVIVVAYAADTMKEVNFQLFSIHIIRNVFHFTGQNLWFFALQLIPLAQLFALEFTSPIWVMLLAPILLGEKLTLRKFFLVVLGFIGVLIVARPEIGALNTGILAGAAAAIGFAGAAILTSKLTHTDSLTKILFFLTGLQLLFGLICTGYDGDIALPNSSSLPWVIVIGTAGLMAHLCLTKSLSMAPASVVMPIDFARLPLIAILAVIFYDEALDIFVILGASLILLSNYVNLRCQS
jgi:drug/metabolite transporter (DMT)-like permease